MTIKWPFWFDDVFIVIVVVLILLGYRSSCTTLFLFYIWEYLMFYWVLEIFCSEYTSVSNSFLMSIFAFYSVGIRIIYVKSLHIHRNIISRFSLCCWIMLNIYVWLFSDEKSSVFWHCCWQRIFILMKNIFLIIYFCRSLSCKAHAHHLKILCKIFASILYLWHLSSFYDLLLNFT